MFVGKMLRCRPVDGLMFCDNSGGETDRFSREEKKTIMSIRILITKSFL